MNCPTCGKPLAQRRANNLTVYACQGHGIWQPWETVQALARAAADNEDDDFAEGFILGRFF